MWDPSRVRHFLIYLVPWVAPTAIVVSSLRDEDRLISNGHYSIANVKNNVRFAWADHFIPAEAGIQSFQSRENAGLDPGLRRGDGHEESLFLTMAIIHGGGLFLLLHKAEPPGPHRSIPEVQALSAPGGWGFKGSQLT